VRQLVTRHILEHLRARTRIGARATANEHVDGVDDFAVDAGVLAEQPDIGSRVIPASGRTS